MSPRPPCGDSTTPTPSVCNGYFMEGGARGDVVRPGRVGTSAVFGRRAVAS